MEGDSLLSIMAFACFVIVLGTREHEDPFGTTDIVCTVGAVLTGIITCVSLYFHIVKYCKKPQIPAANPAEPVFAVVMMDGGS